VTPGPPPVPGRRSPEEREAARREREGRRAARQGDGVPPPVPNGAATPPVTGERTRPAPPRRPTRRGARLAALLVTGAAVAVAAWFLVSLFQPFAGDGGEAVRVAVPKGASVGEIGDLLAGRGVISSSFFFQARARLSGKSADLKPGSYRLRRDMSYSAVLDRLAEGPPRDVVTVVVPEGRSRPEVARALPDGLTGSYLRASRRSSELSPRSYGARRARSLEGFLFPATYDLKRGRPMSVLVGAQLAAFKREFAKVDLRFARKRNLTPYDVLIIASMVEREAAVQKDRPLIASVIYNRLRRGMRLQIDATLRFGLGNWRRPLRQSELRSHNPYNTYTHSGLPPGPIGNPGLASIEAAAHPARSRYLYYVVKPYSHCAHSFARTAAGFERLKNRYDRARARRGGRSPAGC
jgi:peptidoglycan lytic transglycosylase G